MKRKRFTEEQIVRILQESDRGGSTVAELCKRHGVSEQSFYRWKKMYGGMEVSEVRRLRELEKENSRLKRLLAERDLEIDALSEVLQKKDGVPRYGGSLSGVFVAVAYRYGERAGWPGSAGVGTDTKSDHGIMQRWYRH